MSKITTWFKAQSKFSKILVVGATCYNIIIVDLNSLFSLHSNKDWTYFIGIFIGQLSQMAVIALVLALPTYFIFYLFGGKKYVDYFAFYFLFASIGSSQGKLYNYLLDSFVAPDKAASYSWLISGVLVIAFIFLASHYSKNMKDENFIIEIEKIGEHIDDWLIKVKVDDDKPIFYKLSHKARTQHPFFSQGNEDIQDKIRNVVLQDLDLSRHERESIDRSYTRDLDYSYFDSLIHKS